MAANAEIVSVFQAVSLLELIKGAWGGKFRNHVTGSAFDGSFIETTNQTI